MGRIFHWTRLARRLNDDELALMHEYDIAKGGTIGDAHRRDEIRRDLLSRGIPFETRRNGFGESLGYWDLGGGHLIPTTTDGWRSNETYCARCGMQRPVPHHHWWWFFWVCEYPS